MGIGARSRPAAQLQLQKGSKRPSVTRYCNVTYSACHPPPPPRRQSATVYCKLAVDELIDVARIHTHDMMMTTIPQVVQSASSSSSSKRSHERTLWNHSTSGQLGWRLAHISAFLTGCSAVSLPSSPASSALRSGPPLHLCFAAVVFILPNVSLLVQARKR